MPMKIDEIIEVYKYAEEGKKSPEEGLSVI